MIITAAATEEEEEGRLTESESNLFPPFPICGRIAEPAISLRTLASLQCNDGLEKCG